MQATTNFRNSIYLLLAIFCLLIFPHYSQEFGFKFGGDDATDEHGKQLAKHRAIEKKFKFRKIERVFVDTENNDDDDDIDVDKTLKSDISDENDVQFERVHKAQKDERTPKKQSREKRVKATTSDEADSSETDSDQSQSFLSRIFGGFFGSDKEEKKDVPKESEKKPKYVKTVEEKSNSIIDSLKWLGMKFGKSNAAEEKEKLKDTDSWWMYLDRWPINSFFPIGKQPKPVSIPRQKNSVRQNDDDSSTEASPMSQEHFESLLHTLPGFVVNASHVSNTECRQHMQIFHRQLRGNKLWTLQMLDATGKISSGILRGNINQFGDFDLCTQIRTVVKVTSDIPMRIRGKYCLAHIETQTDVSELKLPVYLAHARELWNSHLGNPGHFAPRYAVANWGVCIPHSCPAEVVQEMIETNLRPYNTTGIEFHVEVNDNDCYMRQSRKWTKLMQKDNKFAMTVVCISSLALLVFISLLYEQWGIVNKIVQALKNFRGTNENIKTESNGGDDEVESNNIRPEEANSNENNPNEEINATTNESSITTDNEHSASLKQFLQEIIRSFSPRRTLAVLLSEENTDFPILHVLKLGATFMLYVCLKYLMIGHLPITNRDKLVRAVDHPFSIMFRAPLLYADILLLIGGFFSAYQLSSEMELKSYIQLLKCLVSKICRYLPTLYVVILFQTWILPHLNSGPLWTNLIGQNSRLCEQHMWRNVFSVQNAIDFEETCSPMTISLALEVQLFLLGPLIVWLYYTNSDAAFYIYGAIHAMSVAARFSRTNREHLSVTLFHGINVSKFYRTANVLYSSPISRATPYLLGIGAGLFHRSECGSLQCAANLIPLGWILTILGILWCFWAPSTGMTGSYIYTPSDAASYAAWSPLILGLAICWLIFMFPKTEKSVLRFLTNSRPIIFLSRITYPIQLVMYVVVLYNTASVKEAQKFHMLELININEIGIILLYATMLAFIVDIPTNQIRRLLVNRLFKERIQTELEPISQSEASEEPSEQIVSDTPEPPETIWASDPEEEEQKYLTRRRSSVVNTDLIVNKTDVTNSKDQREPAEEEVEEEEEEEEEVEIDITEAEEVKKSPIIPPKKPVVEETKPTYTRRRRPISDD